jgi:hypothetical protein
MQFKQSPNYAKGTVPKVGFVLHGTLGNYAGAVDWLLTGNRPNPSSAHYIIGKNEGEVIQLVQNADVAWHCGTVRNPLPRAQAVLKKDIVGNYINPNQYLIGIEFVWFAGDTLTEWQYNTAIEIIKASGIANPILIDHHSVCDYKTDDVWFAVEEVTKRLAPTQTIKESQTVARPTHVFTSPLPYGIRSADVVYLQQILAYEGLMTAGQGSGTYDNATAQAVKALQLKHNIATPSEITKLNGMRVGALTLAYLNKTYGH